MTPNKKDQDGTVNNDESNTTNEWNTLEQEILYTEKAILLKAIAQANGDINQVSKILDLNQDTLLKKLSKHNIKL